MNSVADNFVTESDIQAYQRDGAVRLRQVISVQWLDLLREAVALNLNEAPHSPYFRDLNGDGSAFTDMFRRFFISQYDQAARESQAPAIAGALMGAGEVVLIEEQMFVMNAGSTARTPWHHDLPYYPLEGSMCIVWVPLQRHETSETLEFIGGSHRWGRQFVPRDLRGTAGHALYADKDSLPAGVEILEDIDANRSQFEVLAWDVDPGDCLVFSPLTLHGTRGIPPSRTVSRVALRYGGEDLVARPTKFPWVFTQWPFEALREGERLMGEDFPVVWSRLTEGSHDSV